MYLSKEKGAKIQKCFENQRSNIEFNSGEKKENHIKRFNDTGGKALDVKQVVAFP